MSGGTHDYFVLNGFVNGFTSLQIDGTNRSDLPNQYPRVLRYTKITTPSAEHYVNPFGSIVSKQSLGTDARDEALRQFGASDTFYARYRPLLTELRGLALSKFTDTEFSYIASFNADADSVSWGVCELSGALDRETLLIEATLAYLHRQKCERLLDKLSEGRKDPVFQQYLVEYFDQLAIISKPSNYLVNNEEIALMERFYREWQLDVGIDRVFERLARSVQAYQFIWDYQDKKSESSFNLLAFSVAVLAVIQLGGDLVAFSPFFSTTSFKITMVALSSLIFVIAIYRWFISDTFALLAARAQRIMYRGMLMSLNLINAASRRVRAKKT